MNKAPEAFRTISEVADELDLPQHVLRFWESRFPHIRPMKRGGGRRYYRPEDIDLLRGIRRLLYGDGYTIRGVQRILREQGIRTVQSVGQGQAANLPAPRPEDVQDMDGGANGAGDAFKFPLPTGSPSSDPTGDKVGEPDEPVPAEFAPQNRPMDEANSVMAAPIATVPGAVQAHQDSLSAAVPLARGMAAEDLERLNHALAELEASRRLLDKAQKGGR